MDSTMDDISLLKQELIRKDEEIQRLTCLLKKKESSIPHTIQTSSEKIAPAKQLDKLDNPSISRYSRQLILPELGVTGQLSLCQTSVLIVGCGGLGCPAAVYLAAAGVGRLGLVDFDEVELSNLHRQVLHTESRINVPKSASAATACNQLNSSVICIPYHLSLDSNSAIEIIKNYDIVLDATDNVATRYLLNDACVLAKKPLISGSALRFEGQLTVYNHEGGPCYRCLYPKPPPPETVTNCSDGGVLGVVPGIIGCLQALEAIKIAAKMGSTYSQRLLLFDALDGTFRIIKLRPKQSKCDICGTNPTLTKLIDYEQFCGAKATDKDKNLSLLDPQDRICVQDYKKLVDGEEPHILVDVRQPVELDICHLPGALNIPLDKIENDKQLENLQEQIYCDDKLLPVYLLCRRGNDSQIAVRKLQGKLTDTPTTIKDIKGGLTAWSKHIDPDFPVY